jgi:hypothetical protein
LGYLRILKNLSLLFQREQLFVSTTELHVKNTVTLLESLKCNPGQNKGRFITNTSIHGIYQDVHLHELNDTARSSIESEKKNMIMHGVNTWKNDFLIRESSKDPQQSLILSPGQLEMLLRIMGSMRW